MIRHKWTYRFHNLIAHPLLILWPSVGAKLHEVWDFELGPLAAPHNLCKNCGHHYESHDVATLGPRYVSKRRLKCTYTANYLGGECSCPVFDPPPNNWNVKLSKLWWRNFQ